jgi:hypothetical protein
MTHLFLGAAEGRVNKTPGRSSGCRLVSAQFASQTVRRCISLGPLDECARLQLVRDFPDDLGLDGLDELRLLLHRNQKGSRITDNAVAVVEIEILDILEAVGRLQHDQQAVYGDATGQSLVAGQGHGSTRVVDSVAGDVDHLPIRLQAALTELPDAEVDGA